MLLAATVVGAASPAATDSIHLVGGRVIHTESARIEEGRVIFTQFGGTVSIPLDTVVRIVADDEAEQPTTPSPARGAQATANAPGRDESPAAAGRRESSASVASADADARATVASPDEPEYWIERILEVDGRIAEAQARLDRLPLYDEVDRRLLRFSGQARYFIAEREKWEKLMRDLEATRQRLLRDARKAGIPPGALRKGLRR